MDKKTYKKTGQRQHREGISTLVCPSCGEEDPIVIEFHHPFGRNNSDETVPLCKNCHIKISQAQNKISPKSRSKKASPEEKRGYLLVSVGSLLELMGKTLKNLGYEAIHHE